ncbi:hypothetical protein [Dongshaea marina]|uniref:hypothetical protein n=1 Tax=Dongshaea marina TaxID=2047966 RepID=UPI000D3E4820|nr:hypothetical protein [Dongshaea marina]
MVRRWRSLFIVLLLALGLTACSRVQPVMNMDNYPIPAGLTMKQIQNDIIAAGSQLGWTIVPQKPGQMIGTLYLRSHKAEVTIRYNQKLYSIIYLDSSNLNYKDGQIHPKYNQWVRNLNKYINQNLHAH